MANREGTDGNLDIDALIIDMDGVLWRGEEPIGTPAKVFSKVQGLGWRVLLLTNNSTRSVGQYGAKLSTLGIRLDQGQILNTAAATASYLAEHYPLGTPVYVIGEQGLLATLNEAGFHHDPELAKVVVAGLDRSVTYEKLRRATLLIRGGAHFIGTNPDRTIPAPEGLLPGAGSILAALEAATAVQPVIIGKPGQEMFRQALDRLGTAPERTLVIGDRLETDIAGGQAAGCRTGLVLSGVTTQEEAAHWTPAPDVIAEDLAALLAKIPAFPVSQNQDG